MNSTNYLWILVSLSLLCCKRSNVGVIPSGLTKLSNQELIERARVGNFPDLSDLTYINSHGDTITRDSLIRYEKFDELAFDDYMDENGIVKITLIREATDSDKELRKKINEAIEEGPKLNIGPVDCEKLGPVLDSVLVADQKNRENPESFDWRIDLENLEKVVSILEFCGMPNSKTVSKRQLSAIWLVIQHSNTKYQKKYLPIFKASAKAGDLDKRDIFMMEDRILVSEGKPQIYGTQVRQKEDGSYELYETITPKQLNQRREKAGFEPIEDYLMYWGISFEIPQE